MSRKAVLFFVLWTILLAGGAAGQKGDLPTAMSSLQWTLRIHPYYEPARTQLVQLERLLREQKDC